MLNWEIDETVEQNRMPSVTLNATEQISEYFKYRFW